jgi:hypothetical protein
LNAKIIQRYIVHEKWASVDPFFKAVYSLLGTSSAVSAFRGMIVGKAAS